MHHLESRLEPALRRSPWWRRVEPRQLLCETGETARTLRRHRGARLMVVESPLGAPFPGHRERLRIRDALLANRDILLFTEASHTHHLLSGVVRTGGGARVIEEFRSTDDPSLLATLFAHRRVRRVAANPERRAGRTAVLAAIAWALPLPERGPASARLPGSGSADHEVARHAISAVARRIRGIDDPRQMRRLAATLDRVVIAGDFRAGGERLLGAADALEWLRRLALARMRSFLADAGSGTNRSGFLRDFRSSVEAADEAIQRRVPCLVRRMIAQRQLIAIAAGKVEASSARRAIGDWIGFAPDETLAIDTNVLVVDPREFTGGEPGVTVTEMERALVDPPDPGDGDILAAAWRLVADERLTRHDVSSEVWRKASDELERRRGEQSAVHTQFLTARRPILMWRENDGD